MTGAGDLYKYQPGASVTVEITANSNGNVALRGDGVTLTGENSKHTEASLTASAGTGAGFLADTPEEYTGSQSDYSAGDSAGVATLEVRKPVAVLPVADDFDPDATGTQTPSVGEEVQWASGGVIQLYDSTDAPVPYGEVFATGIAAADAAAVVVHR